jgi:hypothetical protein
LPNLFLDLFARNEPKCAGRNRAICWISPAELQTTPDNADLVDRTGHDSHLLNSKEAVKYLHLLRTIQREWAIGSSPRRPARA